MQELNGILTATLLFDRSRSLQENVAVLVHELFHAFQRKHHPEWQANEVELLTYPEDDVEILALRWLEFSALGESLSQRNRDKAVSWARALLETRKKRFSAMAPGAVDYERGIELVEGTAYYVEDLVAARNPDPLKALEKLCPGGVRAILCESGRCIAFLLDRVCRGWKDRLERGIFSHLDEILAAETEDVPPAQLKPQSLRKARTWAERKREELFKARALLLREYLERPGWTLEVEVLEPLWPAGFDPMNVVRLDERRVLHRRWLSLTGRTAKIECLGRECLTEAFGDHPLFQDVRRLLITGLEDEPSVDLVGSRVEIKAEGVQLRLKGVKIERIGRVIRIRPLMRRGEDPGKKGEKELE